MLGSLTKKLPKRKLTVPSNGDVHVENRSKFAHVQELLEDKEMTTAGIIGQMFCILPSLSPLQNFHIKRI